MLKKFAIAAAAAGLMASTALAQAPNATPTGSPNMPTASSSALNAKFVTAQTADQWNAAKFIGTDVVGTGNQKIGDVSDVLFDRSGKILAYIVGVGGFLGIGAKDVALEPTSFEVIPANEREDAKLKLAMSQDDLKAAPEFKAYAKPRVTTGAGGTSNRPAGGMTSPAPAPMPAQGK